MQRKNRNFCRLFSAQLLPTRVPRPRALPTIGPGRTRRSPPRRDVDEKGTKMNCPHCNVPLVMTERQGVEIDYCPQCRGVWLDRGELDKIIERQAAFEQRIAGAAAAPPPPAPASPY